MLGTDLCRELSAQSFSVTGVGLAPAEHLKVPYFQMDLSAAGNPFEELLRSEQPDLIFHTAAQTDVDKCEQNPELARKGNLELTRYVADASKKINALLFFFSTDYVFDGNKKGEYLEEDIPNPKSCYGESKFFAERYIHENLSHYVIMRLSWLYGIWGKSFPRSILERAQYQSRFEVVSDQMGRPT